MTTTAEPTTPTPSSAKSRTRKEDARLITGRTRWTDNIVLPGMLHLAMVRCPISHARITGIDAEEARTLPGVVAVYTARRPRRRARRPPLRLADHADQSAAARRRSPSTPCTSPARASPSSSPATPPPPGTPPSSSTSTTTTCRPVLDMEAAARRRRHPDAPGPRHQHSAHWCSTPARPAPGGSARRRHRRRGERPRRRRRPPPVPPAAADPGVHGAALGGRRPVRRAADHVVGDADPAHPQDAGRGSRSACPSTSCG